MAQNENGLIDGFKDSLKEYAKLNGKRIYNFSTGGADRDILSDALHTDGSKFFLVEYKYNNYGTKNEISKEKSLSLCQKLSIDEYCKKVSRKCHFYGFGKQTSEHTLKYMISGYFMKICEQIDKDYPLKKFINHFFSEKNKDIIGVNKVLFLKYITCILSTTSYQNKEYAFILNVYNPEEDEYEAQVFNSVESLVNKINISSKVSDNIFINKNNNKTDNDENLDFGMNM